MAPQSVLFVCTHNAGRSQLAAGFLGQLAAGTVRVESAGTAPADALNPSVVAAMLEVGVDLREEEPQLLSAEMLQGADLVVAIGVDLVGVVPAGRYVEWDFPDPADSRLPAVRPIRDAIRSKVVELLAELNAPAAA
ncbi:low molecular weight phosphatase family protein [Micropruina sp.]|uniref:arsenate-mycothiol transferase ArsC n=1 Tax=Micropruina sp. TaxID=2737536 RepID=UPI0039E3CB08